MRRMSTFSGFAEQLLCSGRGECFSEDNVSSYYLMTVDLSDAKVSEGTRLDISRTRRNEEVNSLQLCCYHEEV